MASRMIGRAACPECGFSGAHVKQSEKCLYRWCPECGAQHYAKTERQRADLMAKTRTTPGATPTGSEATPAGATATDTASGTESGSGTATTSAAGGTGSGTATAAPAGQPAKRSALFGW